MNKPVIILGGGGHAKVLIDALRRSGVEIVGVADPGLKIGEPGPLGTIVMGDDEMIAEQDPARIELVNGIGSVSNTRLRREVYGRFKAQGYRFFTVVHPSAILGEGVFLGEGAQIMAGVVVQVEAQIGANSIVNTRASIDHDCTIGEHCHIAPGVTISGGVSVGASTHIGTGAVVIQNIRIGAECLVGAGAVLRHDLPEKARFTGGSDPLTESGDPVGTSSRLEPGIETQGRFDD